MDPGSRDPYDAIVYHTPAEPADSKTQAKWKQAGIFREETPARGRQEDPRQRAQVPRDEVCVLDDRGGHRRIGLHCPHGLFSDIEHVADVDEAEYAAMYPTPPDRAGDRAVQGTDFGRGTR